MIKDEFKDKSVVALKSIIAAERILKDIGYHTNMSFGESVDVNFTREKHTRFYGSYKYDYYSHTFHVKVKETWYDDVFLNGVGAVTYNNTKIMVLDAVEVAENNLKADFQDLGFRLFKVKIPVLTKTEVPIVHNLTNGTSYTVNRTHHEWEVAERFMVATPIQDGQEAKCFAAKHPNAAASNLKKWMIKQMEDSMGI